MITSLVIALAFIWLGYETDWMRVRLPIGILEKPIELERLSWDTCIARYGFHKQALGIFEPICGWDWLKNNTHPVPQVRVSFTSGGVRYKWHIKDTIILKDAITATHAKPKNGNGQLHFRRNKSGGLIAPLPVRVK